MKRKEEGGETYFAQLGSVLTHRAIDTLQLVLDTLKLELDSGLYDAHHQLHVPEMSEREGEEAHEIIARDLQRAFQPRQF